jgi:hypothetical protein
MAFMLEEAERDWDDFEQELEVTIDIEFSDSILPTGALIFLVNLLNTY